MASLRAFKNNIISKAKISSNKKVITHFIKTKKKFFNTEIYEDINKFDKNTNSLLNCDVKTFFPIIKNNESIKYKSQINIYPLKNKEHSLNSSNKGDMDIFTRSIIKPKECKTVVKFHNFPENFPNARKDYYKKINLDHVFSVLNVYKPDFKF
jgi:hypothetical protein